MSDNVYLPILKAREGEFTALGFLKRHTVKKITPVIECVLPFAKKDEPAPTSPNVVKTVEKVAKYWGTQRRVIIDLGPFAGTAKGPALSDQLAEASQGAALRMVPGIRLNAPDPVVHRTREAAAALGQGVCVRVTGSEVHDDPGDIIVWLRQLLADLATRPSEVDLVIDCGIVSTTTLLALAVRIHALVCELARATRWRTLAVAGGSFPEDLRGVPNETIHEISRVESALWSLMRTRTPFGGEIAFADYCVAWPPVQELSKRAFPAPPQLRYTAVGRWLAARANSKDPRGNRFYEVSELVTEHPEFSGPEFSWGDQQIARAAARDGIGCGTATQWRAYATNHHVEFVVERLTTVGEP